MKVTQQLIIGCDVRCHVIHGSPLALACFDVGLLALLRAAQEADPVAVTYFALLHL